MRDIIFKKITASVLLALMLIVHAVIFFHHHHTPSSHDNLHQVGVFDKSNTRTIQHCPICEFKLNRDVDVQIQQVSINPIKVETKTYTGFLFSYSSLSTSALHLRGPPANA